MPAMLSGVAFRNEVPFPEFLARHPSPSFPGAGAALFYWSFHEVELWELEQ